ncbi:MAG: flagellar protein FlgN [Clostridia bacterium]
MDRAITQLIDILNKEKAVYQDIQELSLKKKDVIAAGKIEELDRVVTAEQSLIMLAGNLARSREKCMDEIETILGDELQEKTLSALIRLVPKERAEVLTRIQEDFTRLLEEQKRLNEINEKLIRMNLEFVELSKELFGEEQLSSEVYRPGGKKESKENTKLLDQKI